MPLRSFAPPDSARPSYTLRVRHVLAPVFSALMACGGDTGTGPAQPSPPAQSTATQIEIQPGTITFESINDTTIATVTARDAQGHIVPSGTIVWSSDQPAIASVENGIVVARAPGSATVTATLATTPQDVRATVGVTVAPRARTYRIDPSDDVIGIGGQIGLELRGYDARGTLVAAISDAIWKTSDPAVASISTAGILSGKAVGSANVTATISGTTALGRIAIVPPSGIRVSADALNTCALSTTNEAYCWGFNDQGQLGTTSAPNRCTAGPVVGSYPCAWSPQKVAGGLRFRSIATGFEHTCALDLDGRAYCWGANDRGQLGSSDAQAACVAVVFGNSGPCSYVPIAVSTTQRFIAIGAGYRTTCALSTDHRVFCWGNNEQGSVGVPNIAAYSQPVEISGGYQFSALTVGWLHACGLTADGVARCWGHNGSGQVGDGTWEPKFSPTPVLGALTFAFIAAGKEHTCAGDSGHEVFCWGQSVGFIPTGRYGSNWEAAPLPTVDHQPVDDLTSGAGFACGLYAGWAKCWGSNQSWTLGGPLPGGYPLNLGSMTPVAVPVRATFESIAAGFSHACGVRTGGFVYCWGEGIEGELGDGVVHPYATEQERARPVRVALP